MAKLTLKKIQKAISDVVKKHNDSVDEQNKAINLKNGNKSWRDDDYIDTLSEINQDDPDDLFDHDLDFGDLKFTEKEDFGGEGMGDHCHKVYLVTQKSTGETAYIKFDGYYNSNDGSSYDDGFELVEPYMKQVRDWKVVK